MGSRAERNRAINATAARQFGLITHQQLFEMGISRNGIRSRVDSGTIVRVCRGVFRLPGVPVTCEQRTLCAYLANQPGGVVSHFAAARLLGIDVGQAERVDVTIPIDRRGIQVPHSRLHHSRGYARGEIICLGPFRVTSIPRTLIDLAPVVPRDRLVSAMDAAILGASCSPKAMTTALNRPSSRGRKGTRVLRHAIEPWLGESTPKSVAEARLLRAILASGIPRPVCQFEVRDGSDFVALVDFAWPRQRVGLEMDGYAHHGSAAAFGKDFERSNRLAALGWFILRTTPRRFAESPGRLFTSLRKALAAGAEHGGMR